MSANRCDSCEALTINGAYCHERGCPEAWRDERRECPWDGCSFSPEESGQRFCDDSCAEAYHGGCSPCGAVDSDDLGSIDHLDDPHTCGIN